MEQKWLIWSEEHETWWMPKGNGYTHKVQEAGRYTFEQAVEIVSGANQFEKCRRPNEMMVPDWIGAK